MAAIILDRVTVSYNEEPVLDDLTFVVEEGEFWAIVGPNGTGKTTLVKTILGLLKPRSGTVYVFGCPVQKVCPHRKQISYVPQSDISDPNFPVTSLDVVLTGIYGQLGLFRRPSKRDREKALALLEEVGLLEYADYPFGRLSGGQRRRVMIARALMGDPKALILDEPTQGVDVASQEKLVDLIEDLYQKKSIPILFVTHNVNPILHLIQKVVLLGVRRHKVGGKEILFDHKVLREIYGKDVEIIRLEHRDFIITDDFHHG